MSNIVCKSRVTTNDIPKLSVCIRQIQHVAYKM